MADKCPNMPQVLGGYSQGASLMDIVTGDSVGGLLRGTALPAQYANMIAAVVTFGNVADRSDQPITTQSLLFGSRAIDLCNPRDPICHAGPGNEWSGHTEGYVPFYTDQAASFVVAKLLGVQSPTTSEPSATLAPSTAAGPYATPGPSATSGPSATLGPSATSGPYATSEPSATLAPSTAAESPTAFH
jgi:cutinase